MKEKIYKGLKILMVLALILGIFVVVRQSTDYKRGEQDYNEAEQLANLPARKKATAPSIETVLTKPKAADPYAEMLKNEIDLDALRQVNSDVIGWIDIPGTEISYPILQGENNEFYLKHTWKKESNSVGSVFLECKADPQLADFNTIIYGHRMRDLSMFGSLKYYEDISYWEENPSVYVVIDEEAYRYDIYASYKADPEDIIYGLKINSRPKKQEVVQFGLDHSVIETGIIPSTFDRILTLSTCTGNGHASRWVVQAVYRVEASDTPGGAGNTFEGTDDVTDSSSSSNSKDSLTFSDTSDSSRQSGLNLPEINQQVIVLAGVILAILIIVLFAAYRIFRKKK